MKCRFVKAAAIAISLVIALQDTSCSVLALENTETSSVIVTVPETETNTVQNEEVSDVIDDTEQEPEAAEPSEQEGTEEINVEEPGTEFIEIEETEVTEEVETVETYSTDYPNTWTNTGDGAADIVGVALTQVGYQETGDNHTKYAAWFYGKDESVAWCAIFISWCANQAGISQSVIYKNASASGSTSGNPYGTPGYAFGTITPRPGDIIFVENNGGGTTDHVGLVVAVDDSYIYTVEGNYSDQVANVKYSRSNGYRTWANGVQSTKAYISFIARPKYAGSAGTVVEPTQTANYETGTYTVDASNLNVREGAGTQYTVIGQLNSGDEIKVTQVSGDWGQFTVNGMTGWVNLGYCKLGAADTPDTPETTGTQYTISASTLNVRSGAGSAYSIIGTVKNGDIVTITEESDGWGKIDYNGQDGWVSMAYCSKVATNETTETTTEAATVTTTEAPVTTTTSASDPAVETTTASASSLGVYSVTASSLTVRKGPSSSYASLGALARGTEITVLSETNGWGKINYNSQTGYVYMYYLEKKNTETTTEITTTATEKPVTTTTEKTTVTTTEQTTTTTQQTTTTTTASSSSLGVYRVTASSLTVRKGTSSSYASLGTLPKGTEVVILKQIGNWGMINYNGQTGYIYMSYVVKVADESATTTTEAVTTTTTETPVTTTTEKTVTTTTEAAVTTTTAAGNTETGSIYKATTGLNVRSGPGTSYSVIGGLSQDQEVTVYEITNGWARITYEKKTGYVSAKYLTYVGPEESFEEVSIVAQPQSVTVDDYGDTATVSVEASGTGLSYRWYYKDPLASGYTATSFTTASCSYAVTSARNGRQLYCIITDSQGNKITTNTVYMRVAGTLVLTTAPKDVVVAKEGFYASIIVEAIGEEITYTWYYKNAGDSAFKLASCTSNTYRYAVTAARDGRQVYCVIADRFGNRITTDTVTMTYAK